MKISQRIQLGCVLLGLLTVAGCAQSPPVGPLYIDAAEPKPGLSRVYLYRVDAQHSFSKVEIRFDNQDPVEIFDEEYLTTEFSEGTHEIAFRLIRRLGIPNGGWSKQRIRAKPGETLYLEISVGISERPLESGRGSAIAGRSASGTAGEVVSMRAKDEREAKEKLRLTHLHLP